MDINKFEVGEWVIPHDFALGMHSPIGAQLACVGEKHRIQDFRFDRQFNIYMYEIHASDGFDYYWPESSLEKCAEKPVYDLGEFAKAAMQGLCAADGGRVIPKGIAVFAVEIARETIKELEKQNS